MQFTVENLGKVSKADIDLKPLTIFIGKNGSGKTYVASALWAYVSYIKSIQNNVVDFIPKDIWDKYCNQFNRIVEQMNLNNQSLKMKISRSDVDNIIDFIQKKLDVEQILKDCLNHNNFLNSDIILEKISVIDIEIDIELSTEIKTIYGYDEFGVGAEDEIEIVLINFYLKEGNELFSEKSIEKYGYNYRYNIDKNILFGDVIFEVLQYLFLWKNSKKFSSLFYIPAARTGLMFGLHNFANTSLEQQNHFGVKKSVKNQYDLTAPLNDFISKLYREIVSPFILFYHSDSKEPSSYDLIDGKITVNRQDKRFKYIPKSLNQELPLSASSSLVTETAVLSIFNSSIRKGSFVIFEEPEAHLHLSAQREMAKLIVKMINQGCHMLITTHSDTFLQQLNNLIMLNKLSENNPDILQEFNIEPDETIAGERVAVYDFQYQDNDKTIAKPLELGDYGFIAPSVNDEINNLIHQTDTIIDMIDDLKSNGE